MIKTTYLLFIMTWLLSALLKITEDWKKALDENKFVAAILMDLPKAFDCLPQKLLINKLDAFGVSESALKLIKNFLSRLWPSYDKVLLSA
jgi:hypothetical protein